jgi:hypothetical protein
MTRTWYALHGADLFAVAGIWRSSDEWGDVYSMVMVDGCPQMSEVHDRMPVILRLEHYEFLRPCFARRASPAAAQQQPRDSAKAGPSSPPSLINRKTLRPCQNGHLRQDMGRGAKPYRPRRPSPARRRARQPIKPAHSSGAASMSEKRPGKAKQYRASG